MKKNKIVWLLFVIIIVVVIVDLSLMFQKKKENIPIVPSIKEQENVEKIKGDEYFCITSEKSNEMTNKSEFHFIEEYEFLIVDGKVNSGRYQDTITFQNSEDYQYFIGNYIDKNNDYFSIQYEEENLKIIYHKNMILKRENNQSLDDIKEYLEYLSERGFNCEKKQ